MKTVRIPTDDEKHKACWGSQSRGDSACLVNGFWRTTCDDTDASGVRCPWWLDEFELDDLPTIYDSLNLGVDPFNRPVEEMK